MTSLRTVFGSLGLALMLSPSNPTVAGEFTTDPCPPEARERKRLQAEHYAQDPLLMELYALWVGLCTLIAQGELSERRGSELFESARTDIIEQRRMQEGLLPPPENPL